MKTTWIPVLMAAVAAVGSGAEKRQPDIVVYVHNGTESLAVVLAEQQAQWMLAGAGVVVEWRYGTPHYHGSAEVIEAVMTNQPDDRDSPEVLARATLGPHSGTRIQVFYNRIRSRVHDSDAPPILAHVLVHEITHILQGVNRHSETGLMKAHWDPQDWLRMRQSPLPFTDEDIRLIHAWVANRNRRLLAGMRSECPARSAAIATW